MSKFSWKDFGRDFGRKLLAVAYAATFSAMAHAVAPLALLVPDGTSSTAPYVAAWQDAALDEGYSLQVVTDSQFASLGDSFRQQYAGLILPDNIHTIASDALVALVQRYVSAGGRLMLVFDAGALASGGTFAIPRSRFSQMLGIDYVLYDELRDRTVGLGNVVGSPTVLRLLQVPPGKSMPWSAPVVASTTSITSARVASSQSLATSAAGPVTFLPADRADPGGLRNFDMRRRYADIVRYHQQTEAASASAKRRGELPRLSALKEAGALRAERIADVTGQATRTLSALATDVQAVASPVATAATAIAQEVISGYAYGPLTYPSYVTRGTFAGTTLLSSPDHGLVAGQIKVGSGEVLFVNLPLTYLKVETDAMPLHGFLNYFGTQVARVPHLATVPKGIGGMTLNWHLDSNLALEPMRQLKTMGVWKEGPFSMHMTAGPDTITFGDKIGFDLPNNAAAKQFLRDFDAAGHQVGSHGGWIHDYYGLGANESNQADFQKYLVLNRDAIERVLGHKVVEYSAPAGNNPKWAVSWLENQGFRSMYFVGDTGAGVTRHWREGSLLNPKMWVFPVVPYGAQATFEEFRDANITDAALIKWYHQLIDWNIQNHTTRLIYMHPPGAMDYAKVTKDLITYAHQKQSADDFRWYTMDELARFMERRRGVNWQVATVGGVAQVTVSAASSLQGMTWLWPRDGYARPKITSGSGSVASDSRYWVVTANSGSKLTIAATPSTK